jgi:DNA-binding beta-propeller fold protein YncE
MRTLLSVVLLTSLASTPLLAQRPSIPPRAIDGPALNVTPVPLDEAFSMPDGIAFDSVADVDIDANGHVIVLHRGPQALLEFDSDGRFIRAFGEGLFRRSHSLDIDRDGNYWTTDFATQLVMKLSPSGEVLMTIGTVGEAGNWDEDAGIHLFDQPNDIAFDSAGNFYVTQGHGSAEPMVLKFDRDANFIKSWGSRGTLPGDFAVPHSIVIDEDDLLYIADRENRRIQVFDTDGNFVKGWLYYGMACSLELHGNEIYMTTGFDGQIVKLDKRDGSVLGVTGMPGDGLGEFGEAHFLAVSDDDEIYVADVVNRRVQKYVPD